MEPSKDALLPPYVSIVVPTLNERDNVAPLLEAIDEAVGGTTYEVIFVDDSTDDTPSVLRTLAADYPLQIIHREGEAARTGLAAGVMEGFAAARGTYLCVMDADLQHPPSLLRSLLLRAASDEADIVIPTRYANGGGCEGLSGPIRRVASYTLKEMARLLFFPRLRGVTDPLSGFFLFRADILRAQELRPRGFKILLEILMRCDWQRMTEVPYQFKVRDRGTSKATLKQGVNYLGQLWDLFSSVPGAGRPYKFGLVGLSGIVANFAAIMFLQAMALPAITVWSLAKAVSIASNFGLNRSITFRDRREGPLIWQFVGFCGSALVGTVADLLLVLLLTRWGASLLDAEAVAIPVAMLSNFVLTNRLAFQVVHGKPGRRPAQT